MASRNRPRPSSTITKTPKILQIKMNGGEREDVASEVIELKEQKPIHPPPPSIAVNESRYVCMYLWQSGIHVRTVLGIEK